MFLSIRKLILVLTVLVHFDVAYAKEYAGMMVRIAEIEIESNDLEEYLSILNEEAEASVRLEVGVISIYPMYQKENPTEIRILEIYANRKAYESHLQTPHFKKYKSSTLEMVKSLKLIEMQPADLQTMTTIFRKMAVQDN